jgi:hypothetical protein
MWDKSLADWSLRLQNPLCAIIIIIIIITINDPTAEVQGC